VRGLASRLQRNAEALRRQSRRAVDKEKLEDLARRMEELARRMEKDRKMDPKLAKTMVSRLQNKLRKEAEEETAAEPDKKLKGLRTPRFQRKLVKKMAERMKRGDMAGASSLLGRMRRRLAKNKMDKEELQRLSKDMEELSRQLDKLGLQRLSKQFKEMADQLKGLQDSKTMEKLRKLQEKLADSLQNLQGEMPDLSKLTDEEKELLRELQKMMANMERTEEELQRMADSGRARMLTLEELRKMLQQLKNGNRGDKGGSDGQCGGLGLVPIPGLGQGSGSGSGMSTGGAGQGRGGRPPESGNKTETLDTRIRARGIRKGKIVGQWFVRGLPPREGGPKVAYSEAVRAAESAPDTVRERETIPRESRALVRDYYNKIKGVEP
jgi:hypothetical protein